MDKGIAVSCMIWVWGCASLGRLENPRGQVFRFDTREELLLQIIGLMEESSVSEYSCDMPIRHRQFDFKLYYRIWKKKLVEKRVNPDDQRITMVKLSKMAKLYWPA